MKKTVKHTKNKRNKIEEIASVGVVLLTLLFIVIMLFEQLIIDYRLSKNFIKEKEFKETQSDIVYINFDKLTTSNLDYKQMHELCKEFIRNYDTVTSNVDTSVVVTESTYVDTNGNTIKDNKKDRLHETGPIYLQDKLIVRYINEKGEMRIAGCKMNKFKSTSIENSQPYIIVGIDKIENIFISDTANEKLSSMINPNIIDNETNKPNLSFEFSTEENRYIDELEEVFIRLIENNTSDELREAALKYFTYEGYLTILNGINKLKDKDAKVTVTFSEAGKSSLDINYKDRLVMQLESNNNNTKVLTNIIIKLNEYNKVFDIDII